MHWLPIILGTLFIGIGILVKHRKAHNLIAGYNTMSNEEQANFDIEGYATFFRNFFVVLGVSIVAGYYLFYWVGWEKAAIIWLIASLFLSFPYLLIKGQQYNHNENKQTTTKLSWIVSIFLVLVFAGIMIMLGKSMVPPTISVQDNSIEISGIYGVEIPANKIESIQLIDKLPNVLAKTNGFNFANTLKGHFRLKELGKGKLFIAKDKPPFVKIDLKENSFLIVNYEDVNKTKELYSDLQKLKP